MVLVRVELPAFSTSLNVELPDSATVLDIKREISRVCEGGPRAEGQRIIWRGRPLLDDERIEELWKSPDEPRIVHLAVHPSAWTSTPPQVAAPSTSLPFATPSFSPQPIPRPFARPFVYVSARHEQALSALEQSAVRRLEADILALRGAAVQAVQNHGWEWPTVLDEEFPLAEPGGVKYERTVIEGQTYLRLLEPAGKPTPIQLHALKVLAVSFSILAIPSSTPVRTHFAAASQPPPQLDQILQHLNPIVRDALDRAENARVARPPAVPEIPLRPLLLPLFLLMIRTAILLYFFAPARKPVFGILIIAWMLYEVWRPIRDGLNRGMNRVAEQQNRAQAQPPAVQPAGNGQPAAAALNPPLPRRRRGPRGEAAANELDHQVEAIFEGLGNVNMDNEEDMFRRNLAEPSLGSKVITFFTLFFATLHPAVWNRRRAVLRQRETRIRMDANARAAELDATSEDPDTRARIERQQQLIAQHTERPQWIREYIARVTEGHWVDEAD